MRGKLLVAGLCTGLALGCTSWKRCGYESPGRDAWQQPDRVVSALGLEPGDVVADLGSGSGYFTLRLARGVGESGRVYATDVDTAMNGHLRARLADAGIDHVEVVQAQLDDPGLPDGSIDLVFSSNTYHHIGDRTAYFRRLQQDLAPGGRVAIIDYDERGGWFVRMLGHTVDPEILRREMREAGYRIEAEHDFLERQSFVVFVPDGR